MIYFIKINAKKIIIRFSIFFSLMYEKFELSVLSLICVLNILLRF